MRHRVERQRCPVCRDSPILRPICTGCGGTGVAIVVHYPDDIQIDVHPLKDEEMLRALYPDTPTPVHERTTLTSAWMRFRQLVEITHAPKVQQREMKRAFFAGAHWMLEMCSIQMDPSSAPTADDLEYLQRISAEIQIFNDDIQAGRA